MNYWKHQEGHLPNIAFKLYTLAHSGSRMGKCVMLNYVVRVSFISVLVQMTMTIFLTIGMQSFAPVF